MNRNSELYLKMLEALAVQLVQQHQKNFPNQPIRATIPGQSYKEFRPEIILDSIDQTRTQKFRDCNILDYYTLTVQSATRWHLGQHQFSFFAPDDKAAVIFAKNQGAHELTKTLPGEFETSPHVSGVEHLIHQIRSVIVDLDVNVPTRFIIVEKDGIVKAVPSTDKDAAPLKEAVDLFVARCEEGKEGMQGAIEGFNRDIAAAKALLPADPFVYAEAMKATFEPDVDADPRFHSPELEDESPQ